MRTTPTIAAGAPTTIRWSNSERPVSSAPPLRRSEAGGRRGPAAAPPPAAAPGGGGGGGQGARTPTCAPGARRSRDQVWADDREVGGAEPLGRRGGLVPQGIRQRWAADLLDPRDLLRGEPQRGGG